MRTRITSLIGWTAGVGSTAIVGGCVHRETFHGSVDQQPLVGPGKKAEPTIIASSGKIAPPRITLKWKTHLTRYDANDIARSCFEFLKCHSALSPDAFKGVQISDSVWEYKYTAYIISLDPTIVLFSQESSHGGPPYGTLMGVRLDDLRSGVAPTPLLVHGFMYGTNLPVRNSWSWFSPDIGMPPTKISWDENNAACIQVSTDVLKLCRTDEGLTVLRDRVHR